MKPLGTLETLAYAVGVAFVPLTEDLSAERLPEFLLELGLDGPLDLAGDQIFQQKLSVGIKAVEAVSSKLELLDEATNDEDSDRAIRAATELQAAILAARESLDEVASDLKRAAASTPLASSAADLSTQLVDRLFDYSLVRYLEESHPSLLSVLEFLTIAEVTVVEVGNDINMHQVLRRRLHFDRLTALIKNPLAVFELAYGWGANDLNAELLSDRLARLLLALNILTGDVLDDLNEPAFGLDLFNLTINTRTDQNPNGLVGTLTSSTQPTTIPLLADSSHWSLDLELDGAFQEGLQVSLLPPAQLELTTLNSVPGGAHFRFRYEAADRSTALLLLGITGSSRVEAKRIEASGGAKFTSNQQGAITGEVLIAIDVIGGKALLVPDGEDGFLSSVLPEELSVDFECGLNWSASKGLTFRGSASLEAAVPVGLSFGSFLVPTLHLALHAGDSGLTGEVSASVALSIGPVVVLIDRVGLTTDITFPENGGNLGVCNLALGFKRPNGASLKIDSAFVTGGGALLFEPDKGQYSGTISLTLHSGITVTAVAIITTRLPGGAEGFSFVVMITAAGFKPIPLGLGFTLTAIGGLLAINRTCNEEFLRQGITDKTLNHLLFPTDPIRDAPQIFGTLNNAFPPQRGSYLFGPVLQICWGTPTLITMDLGVIAELGARRRFMILGRVAAIMPSEENDLIHLEMNAFGVIDFDQSSISLDAVLHKSSLAGFPLTGSMAMRLSWGSSPEFALSIGGFHPAFKPPPQFPVLDRLAISFCNSGDFRLRAECYIAITSNTLQWGAKLELYAKSGKFSIEGRIGFDVLIQFDPFGFIADFYASVQLKFRSSNLFKVTVEGRLAGPRPLHVKGKARFEIGWFSFSVPFDRTLVEGEAPPALEPVNVLELLTAALKEPRNWSDQLEERDRRVVILRERETTDQVVVHPLGRLTVKQSVVPLNTEISKFGNSPPLDDEVFTISRFTIDDNNTDFTTIEDFFAPAQFLDLTDDQKLTSPSFEAMPAGLTLSATTSSSTDAGHNIIEAIAIDYETIYVDKEFEAATGGKRKGLGFNIDSKFLEQNLFLGAAASNSLSSTGGAKYASEGKKNFEAASGWTIVSKIDGTVQATLDLDAGEIVSFSKSYQALQRLKAMDPDGAKDRMLVKVWKN